LGGLFFMNFQTVIQNIFTALEKHNPDKFNDLWIKEYLPQTHRYIKRNIKTIVGDTDWDKIISSLDRKYQKKWSGIYINPEKFKKYKNKREVNKILKQYKHKLYTFIYPLNPDDKHTANIICILLVRLYQKGNQTAQDELLNWLPFIIEEWMDKSPIMYRWLGYSELMEEEIKGCIRRYRYTGSFLGYLYRTLYYRGRGLRSLYAFSFDDNMPSGKSRKIDHFVGHSVSHLSHTG